MDPYLVFYGIISSFGTSTDCESCYLCLLLWSGVKRKSFGSGASVQVWWEQKVSGVFFRGFIRGESLSLSPPSLLSLLFRCGVWSPESQACARTSPGKFIKLHLHSRCKSHRYFTWTKPVPVYAGSSSSQRSVHPHAYNSRLTRNDTERPSRWNTKALLLC